LTGRFFLSITGLSSTSEVNVFNNVPFAPHGEAIAQAAGFRPERLAQVSREHWTMENVKGNFKDRRDDLYSRYRLAKTQEERQKVIRDMQRFNMDARKYRGVVSPINATSLRQSALPKREKPFLAFGRMMEASM
jgi:hypothetical protein